MYGHEPLFFDPGEISFLCLDIVFPFIGLEINRRALILPFTALRDEALASFKNITRPLKVDRQRKPMNGTMENPKHSISYFCTVAWSKSPVRVFKAGQSIYNPTCRRSVETQWILWVRCIHECPWLVFHLWLSKVSASDKIHYTRNVFAWNRSQWVYISVRYICNVFFHWLGSSLTVDRKRPRVYAWKSDPKGHGTRSFASLLFPPSRSRYLVIKGGMQREATLHQCVWFPVPLLPTSN